MCDKLNANLRKKGAIGKQESADVMFRLTNAHGRAHSRFPGAGVVAFVKTGSKSFLGFAP